MRSLYGSRTHLIWPHPELGAQGRKHPLFSSQSPPEGGRWVVCGRFDFQGPPRILEPAEVTALVVALRVARQAKVELTTASHRAKPFIEPLRRAKEQLAQAEATHQRRLDDLQRAPIWRRRSAGHAASEAAEVVAEKCDLVANLEVRAQPFEALVCSAEEQHQQASRAASMAQITERLQHLELQPPTRTLERGLDIDLPGM